MEKPKEQEAEKVEEGSGIDCHIGKTKVAMNLGTFLDEVDKKEKPQKSYASLEFGGTNRTGQIIVLYLYFIAKLSILYLVKALMWTFRRGKRK